MLRRKRMGVDNKQRIGVIESYGEEDEEASEEERIIAESRLDWPLLP